MGQCCHVKPGIRRDGEIDGPYAWIIALASFSAHVFLAGIAWTAGVFYEYIKETFDNSSSLISTTATLSTAFSLGLGPVSAVLINLFGHRVVAIIGGIIAGTGLVLSSYVTHVYFFMVTFGIISGTGLGISYLAIVSIVPLYFNKYRSIALGLAVSGVGFGMFIYPLVLEFLVHTYGLRGSILIIGGVTLNLCTCGMFMRLPKQVKDNDMLGVYEDLKTTPNTAASPQNTKLMSNTVQPRKNKKCLDLWNFHIFNNFAYIILCINNFLCLFGIVVVYVHIVAYTETRGVNKHTAALLVSSLGLSNFIGRPFFGVLTKLPCCSVQFVFLSTLISAGIAAIIIPVMTSFVGILVFVILFGFLTSSIGTLLPQIIAEFLSDELIPSGYGYILVFEAVGCLIGPPIAGSLYDILQVYTGSFYMGGTAVLMSGLVMIVPIYREK